MERRFIILALASSVVVVGILAGCARSPEGASNISAREVSFQISFAGPVNDNNYYYIPIDINGGAEGPTPVFPGQTSVQGWVAGSVTHYVEYHLRQYTIYRVTNVQPLTTEPIGSPLRATPPEAGGKALAFTLDLNQIGATGESVDISFITVDQPLSGIRVLDALGPQGTQFINLDITTDRTIGNAEDLIRLEPENDVLDQNQQIAPGQPTPQTSPLDISDWTITTNV